MKKGDSVKQVMPAPFAGKITDLKIDADTGEIQYLVAGAEGDRWFTADQVEAA